MHFFRAMPILRPFLRVVAALTIALVVGGCFHSTHEVADAFVWNETLPSGATLHLRDLNGAIRVHASSNAQVSLHASKRWRSGREKDVHFATTRSGNDYYVCALWGKATRCDASGYGPRRESLFMRLLSLLSMSTSTRTDMTVNFDVAVPAGVQLDARTVNGNVEATGTTGTVRVSTVNGTVHATGTSTLAAHTVNGSVHLTLDRLGAADSIRAESVNGSVTIEVPAAYEGSVELKTVNGSVASELPVTASGTPSRREISGTVGSAPRMISLETVNGSVRVIKR